MIKKSIFLITILFINYLFLSQNNFAQNINFKNFNLKEHFNKIFNQVELEKYKHLFTSLKKSYNQNLTSQTQVFSAKEKLDTVKLIAQSYTTDYELRAILFSEGIDPFVSDSIDGKSPSIGYYFYSLSKGWFYIDYSASGIFIDTTNTPPFSGGSVRITDDFVDSPIVSDTAETNGGTDFRTEPGKITSLNYELKNFGPDEIGVPDTNIVYWKVVYLRSDSSYQNLDFLIFYIDPLTGNLVSKIYFSFNNFVTVKEKFAEVDSVAKSFDPNSILMYAVGFEDTLIDGRSFFLTYGYLGQNNMKFAVNVFLGVVLLDTTGWLFEDLNKPVNIPLYLDSDTLTYISEINGGAAFRDTIFIQSAGFFYMQSPFDTSKVLFHFTYTGFDGQGQEKVLVNLIDPVNGSFIGSILLKNDDNIALPDKFILYQNYPNPFNPKTKIKYSIPKSSYVSLKVYNLIGREVKEIFQGYQRAGEYEFSFDASDLASGVYFYVLKTDYATASRKMILIK